MKILIIGSGYVSQAYQRYLKASGHEFLVASRSYCDYYDRPKLESLIRNYNPYIVINCAGYTGDTVDDCEVNRQECYEANKYLPAMICEVCLYRNVKMIHISSGCIFDGVGPFDEDDELNNHCYYAICKRNAEIELLSGACGGIYIFRIRMPFGHTHHRRNWLDKLCAYPQIIDGLNSVTWLDQFVGNSIGIARYGKAGIYNAAQTGAIKTIDVAMIAYIKGLRDSRPTEMNVEEFNKTHVKRSAAVLDVSKYVGACMDLGRVVSDVEYAIKTCIDAMVSSRKSGS